LAALALIGRRRDYCGRIADAVRDAVGRRERKRWAVQGEH
jgi:hypothetical protein